MKYMNIYYLLVAPPRIACSAGVHRSVTMAVHLAGLLHITGRRVSLFCPSLTVVGDWNPEVVSDLDCIGYIWIDGH